MDGEKSGDKSSGNFLKRFWFLLWKDNSFKGWIFSLIFIFVIVRFVFFPLLGFISGSSLPLAIVESCSMYHSGDIFSNFNSWWADHSQYYVRWGINKTEFSSFRFDNGLDKGDILLIAGVKPSDVKIGNIIVFKSSQSAPVIHRVMNISVVNGTYYFSTMGDNNIGVQLNGDNNPGGVDEIHINQDQLVGKAVFKVAPFIGWAKLIFFDAHSEDPGLCKGR